jgi:hypothetical protein
MKYNIKNFYLNITNKKKKTILFFFCLVLIYFLKIKVSLFIFVLFSLIINSILAKIQFTNPIPTDFELSTFSITMVVLMTDLKLGLIYALFPRLIASIYIKYFSPDNFIDFTTQVLIVFVIYYLQFLNILFLGVIISLFDGLLIWIKRKYLLHTPFDANISYLVSRFLLNIFLFFSFGEFVLFLLQL